MSLFSLTLVLFLIMDPVGSTSTFRDVLKPFSQDRRRVILYRELLIALAVLLFFNVIGEYLLHALGVSEVTVRVASGLILFLIAIKMLFPSESSRIAQEQLKGEPFVFPLAVPLVAGPSVLATILLFAHLEPSVPLMLTATSLAWLLASIVHIVSPAVVKVIGESALIAAERLMGMVLVLLAIQRFMEGIEVFLKS